MDVRSKLLVNMIKNKLIFIKIQPHLQTVVLLQINDSLFGGDINI